MFLRAALIALGLALLAAGIQSWRLSRAYDEIERYQGVVKAFEDVQATNLDTIETQTKALERWATANRLNKAKAEAAGARVTQYAQQLDAQTAQNKVLRRELARKDKAVDQYLRSGAMPAALACQLWPDNCQNPNR